MGTEITKEPVAPPVFILYGPTASGKSAVAMHLAQLLPIEIISADSRQVYRFMDVGTAKPSDKDLSTVPHHFINIVNPDESMSAGRFRTEANSVIRQIHQRNRIPVVVGGTGLYVRMLTKRFFNVDSEEAAATGSVGVRADIQRRLDRHGRDALYEELYGCDPDIAAEISDKNPARIRRALEFYYTNGYPLSLARTIHSINPEFPATTFVISRDVDELRSLIEQRTRQMWSRGLREETRALLDRGYSPDLPSMQSVGYRETVEHIIGGVSEQHTIEKISQNTRRTAKKQRTWARHQIRDAVMLSGSNDQIVRTIEKTILSSVTNHEQT